jgi:F-type H+-transporting ATPase subunit delta
MTTGNGTTGEAYARALLEVARSEGAVQRLEDDFYRFARAVEANPQLSDRLSDPGIEVSKKLEVIDDLLGGHPEVASAVMWIIQSGRVRQLSQIADAVTRLAAEARDRAVAEVRTAIKLDDEQERRLTSALERATGRQIELKVVVDPSVVGGLVARVGDTVIDGTIARRLDELRSRLTGA